MVFKSEAVRERLKRLEEVIARLRRYRGQSLEDYLEDIDRQWAVERGFIIAAECVVDIATHILSGKFRIQPSDHEEAIRRLGTEGVIGASLLEKLRGFGGFRNLLVHEYLRIDASRVHESLERDLDSLEEFVAAISDWLAEERD